MAQAAVNLFCHSCGQRSAASSNDLQCPGCQSGFVELIEDSHPLSDMTSAETDSTPQETTLRLLTNSLFNSFHDVNPPEDDTRAPPVFQIPVRTYPQTTNETDVDVGHRNGRSTGAASSVRSSYPNTRRRFHLRFGRRGNRAGNSSASEETFPAPADMFGNFSIEGIIRQVMTEQLQGGSEHNLPHSGMFPLHGNPGDYAWGANGIDDVITQLLGQLDNSGAPPASEEAIKTLKIVTITQRDVDIKRDCSVCMDNFVIEEEAKRLPCEHIFHPNCIDKWLELHNTCPICRTNVESTEDPASCPRPSPHTPTSNTSNPSTSGL